MSDDLVLARTVREREWVHAAWMQRLGWSQMRIAAALPVERGGLGYDLSESALRGLLRGAREDRGDLVLTREERIERRGAELDELGRHARQRLALADGEGRTDDAAAKLLLEVGREERALYGLDEPTRIEADVTTRDAAAVELEQMMARMPERSEP